MLKAVPIRWSEACRFIEMHHRHHRPPQGWKFGIGLARDGVLVGVVTVGRPVARARDDGWTLEVTRCCTDGTANACSKLYALAWRAARAMGVRQLITYTLDSEKGTSLRAAGWTCLGKAGGRKWDHPSRRRKETAAPSPKLLYMIGCAN